MDWLAGLKIHLDAIEVNIAEFALSVNDLTCDQLSVERVQSTFTPMAGGDPQRPGVAAVISGIGLMCETEYRLSKWGFLHTSGTLRVDVQPQDSTTKLTLALPLEGQVAPTKVVIDECSADLDVSLHFSGSILQSIINMFSGLIVSQIKKQVNSDGCQHVRKMAAENITKALNELNCLMLPEEQWVALGLLCDFSDVYSEPVASTITEGSFSAASVRILKHVPVPSSSAPEWDKLNEEGSTPLDLRGISAIRWASWVLKDLIGVNGMRSAASWATHGTGNATVAGGTSPLVSKRITQGTTVLDASVYLADVGVDGLDGIDSFEPLRARSATELDIGLGFGTKRRPDFGVWARVLLRLNASDRVGLSPPSMVENSYTFKVGLQRPSISTTLQLMVDSTKLKTKKLLAQMYFDTVNCTTSYLMSAPQARRLNVTFGGVSEKLEFAAETVGALEADLAQLINHNINLFNAVYLRYLPAAISRTLASKKGVGFLSQKLSTILEPGKCMDKETAEEQASQLPVVDDWRSLLGGQVRKAIDAVADGFMAHNDTDIKKAMQELPHLNFSTSTGTVLDLSAQRLLLQGLDQFRTLRLLLPDAASPAALQNSVSIDCPTDAASWRPSLALGATIAARGETLPGYVEVIAPCGSMEVDFQAVLDMQALLALPVPFPLPCAFRAFSTLSLQSHSFAWNRSGDVLVGPRSGSMRSPIGEFCDLYPRFCSWASGVFGKSGADDMFEVLRQSALNQCSDALRDGSSMLGAQQGSDEPWYMENNIKLWIEVLLATTVVSGIGAAVATQISPGSMCSEWYSDGVNGRQPRAYAHLVAAVLTTVLCFAFILRVHGTFLLPVAVTTAHFDIGPLGSDVESLELITFTLPSMVVHFWEAEAYIASLLLAGGQAISYCVFSLVFCVWFTAFFRDYRRLLVRIAVWMNRMVFVDVVFFAHIIPVLNRDIALPLGITTRLRTVACSAMYVGSISNLLTIVCCFELLRLQSVSPILAREVAVRIAEARAQRPSTTKTMLMGGRALCGVLVLIGMVMWLCCALLTAEFTGLGGFLIPPSDLRGVDLFRMTCIGGPFLGACFFLTAILAPVVQAAIPFVLRLEGRQHSDHVAAKLFREFGDAFAVPDVVMSGYLAFLINADNVARWIGHNKFPGLADGIEQYSGLDVIGVSVEAWAFGVLAMVVGLLGSFGLFVSNAKADISFIFTARSVEPSYDCPS